MHTENLFIDYCSHWQAIKTVRESFPQLYIVPSFTFIFVYCLFFIVDVCDVQKNYEYYCYLYDDILV